MSADRHGLILTEELTRALDLLEAGQSLFLTGKAGTGKSTLIRLFMAGTRRSVVVAAPTGIAALNVGGYTIHRLFSFASGTTVEDVRGHDYYPGRFARVLKGLDTLIIDEASMVRADLLDMLAASLERFGPHPHRPFGGVQLVLVGDLYQLPPVVVDGEQGYFQTRYSTPYFFSADAYQGADLATVQLTHVFRQQGESDLVDILNAVREGRLLEGARSVLNARLDPEFEPPLDELWLTLTTTNRMAAARNRRMLERLPGPAHTFTATARGDLDRFESPAEETLRLAVGAQVMLLSNDPGERWVNGTIGRVEQIETRPGGDPQITVACADGSTVQVREHTWEVTRPVIAGGHLDHEVVGTFTQLPLKLAWAITIHKSQGQTLDRVIVDLRGGTFATGQLYVALSRCTSLEGLVLTRAVLPKDLQIDHRIRRFLRPPATQARGAVYVGMLTVGSAGRQYRPRPVELALVTDDGRSWSTLVNPTSDLYSARSEYGITAAQIQLAPLLTEAWAALAPQVAGLTPIGPDVDEVLGLLDFELKRNRQVVPLPTGVSIPAERLTAAEREALLAPTAVARAHAAQAVGHRLGLQEQAAEAFEEGPAGTGYLLPRGQWPDALAEANLSGESSDPPRRADLAGHLRTAAQRVPLTPETIERIHQAEALLGTRIIDPAALAAAAPDPARVLQPGARVCFTGTVVLEDGRVLERSQMEHVAARQGLRPVASVTKTRCDALVVAEAGTQSNKARKAREYGKPIVTAAQFLEVAGIEP